MSVPPLLERSTHPALELGEPHPVAGTPRWLPLCPLCGDSDLQPAAVCPSLAADAGQADVLALRCSTCGSVVFEAPPDDQARATAPRTPRWLTPKVAAELGGWCRRALQPSAQIVWVGAPDDPVPSFEGRLQCAQSVRRLAPCALQTLPPDAADAVLLPGVLEQLDRPLDMLQLIARSLRRGGYLLVVGLNLDTSAFRWFGGRHWAGYDSRQRHLLSLAALGQLARAAELEVARSAALPFAAGWTESFRRLVQDWRGEARQPGVVQGSALPKASIGLFERAQGWLGRGGIRGVWLRRPERPAS